MNWQTTAADLTQQGLEVITDHHQCQKRSQDYSHFSPILAPQLAHHCADLVVLPRSEAEVMQVVQQCVQDRIPITVRGAGTGNYGQCIPLEGGVVLDLSQMQGIIDLQPGRAVVEPGVKLAKLDQQAKPLGWEIRMAPSTYQTATIGGFLAGGSAGMGSVNYGMINEPGNVQALNLVTIAPEPEVLTLTGTETQAVLHAYGTNGIITAITLPLAPTFPWVEVIVSFADLAQAIAFGLDIAEASGIVTKEVAVQAAPIPGYFTALQSLVAPGEHWVMVMVSAIDLDAFCEQVQANGGQVLEKHYPEQSGKKLNLLEFNWNHTTLLARAMDSRITYLQVFYRDIEQVMALQTFFGEEVMMHLEMMRVRGKMQLVGLPLVRFTTLERLQEIITIHEENGASIANPHAYTIEGGSASPLPPMQLTLKQQVDPLGLLNPGKMTSFVKPYVAKPYTLWGALFINLKCKDVKMEPKLN